MSIDEVKIEHHLGEIVRGTVEETLEDITQALWGTRVSSGTVSKLNQTVYKHIETWRNQTIEGEYPYVYLDGIVLKRSWAGEIKNVSVLVAVGVERRVSAYFRHLRRSQGR